MKLGSKLLFPLHFIFILLRAWVKYLTLLLSPTRFQMGTTERSRGRGRLILFSYLVLSGEYSQSQILGD